jgi:hypothetical protein
MKRSVQYAAAVLLSCTLGLHWVVLQSVAWTAMLIERTRDASFAVAVQTTFDGQHPCKLCKVVEAGKSAEKAPSASLKLPGLEVSSLTDSVVSVLPQQVELSPTRPDLPWVSRSECPLLPPPRLA